MDHSVRTHPLIITAATAVILTCLIAIAVMTGIVPSPSARERGAALQTQPSASAPAKQDELASRNAYAPSTAPVRKAEPQQRNGAPAASGSTAASAPEQTVAGSGPAAAAPCTNCGSVTSVRAIRSQGDASMIGPAAGGLLGGVIGHQIGSGRGNTIATVVGAAGGAAAGTEIERRYKSTTHYVVAVRMGDGNTRQFNYASAPAVQAGDRVRVVQGRLVRD